MERSTITVGNLLQKVALKSYEEINNLVDAFPSMSPELRAEKIMLLVKRAKRRLLQLYAILVWIQEQHVRTYIESSLKLLSNVESENNRFNQILDALYYTHASLYSKRCKSIDIEATTDIIVARTSPDLPYGIFSCKIPPVPKSPDVSLLYKDLNISIRCKIVLQERIPSQFDHSHIHDGVLHLKMSNMFEIQLTLEDIDIKSRWIVHKFEILIQNHPDEGIEAVLDTDTINHDILVQLRNALLISNDNMDIKPLRQLFIISYHTVMATALRLFHVQAIDTTSTLWYQWAETHFIETEEEEVSVIRFWKNLHRHNAMSAVVQPIGDYDNTLVVKEKYEVK